MNKNVVHGEQQFLKMLALESHGAGNQLPSPYSIAQTLRSLICKMELLFHGSLQRLDVRIPGECLTQHRLTWIFIQ